MTRKTANMWELEAKYGKPLREIIEDTVERQGTINGSARELGISRQTLWHYCRFVGIEIVPCLTVQSLDGLSVTRNGSTMLTEPAV